MHFPSKCCISALLEFKKSLLDFFNLFDSRLILTLLYDSLSHVINAVSYWSCWVHGLGEREVGSTAAVGLCCMHKAPVRGLLFPISQGNAEALGR